MRPFPACQGLLYAIQNAIEILSDVFRKEAHHQEAVLLQQPVLSAIPTISFRVREVLCAIEFYDNTQSFVQEIDLHLTLAIERDGQASV